MSENSKQLQKVDVSEGNWEETMYVNLSLRVRLPKGMTQAQYMRMMHWEGIMDGLYVGWESESLTNLLGVDDVTVTVDGPKKWEDEKAAWEEYETYMAQEGLGWNV